MRYCLQQHVFFGSHFGSHLRLGAFGVLVEIYAQIVRRSFVTLSCDRITEKLTDKNYRSKPNYEEKIYCL